MPGSARQFPSKSALTALFDGIYFDGIYFDGIHLDGIHCLDQENLGAN
jgi:hypothetical protein